MNKPVPDTEEDRRASSARARSDRLFFGVLLALVFLVALSQLALRFENVRRALNESVRLEGLPLAPEVRGLPEPAYPWLDWPLPEIDVPTGAMYLRPLDGVFGGDVWVLLNGRPAQVLPPDGCCVTVRDGDRVEVMSAKGEVRLLVSTVSPNVGVPAVGDLVAGEGRVYVCTVSLR